MANPFEVAGRQAKAERIVANLARQHVPAERFLALGRAEQAQVVAMMGVRPCSEPTWALVRELLETMPDPVSVVDADAMVAPAKPPRAPARAPATNPERSIDDMAKVAERLSGDLAAAGVTHRFTGAYRRAEAVMSSLDVVVVAGVPLSLVGLPGYLAPADAYLDLARDITLEGLPAVTVRVWLAHQVELTAMLWDTTGPGDLTSFMRDRAKAKGWQLDQYGLYAKGRTRRIDDPDADEAALAGLLELPAIDPVKRGAWRGAWAADQLAVG